MIKELKQQTEQQMGAARDAVRHRLSKLRTGKASPALLHGVRVDYYGQPTPLNQIANIAAPEPRLLTVAPYDRSVIAAVEKAIRASDLGLNPASDGILVRVPIPELTEERRREYAKLAKEIAEEGRIAVRHARQEANDRLKKLEKDRSVPEDELHNAKGDIQKITDRFVAEIDEIVKGKEKEILEL